MTKEEITSERYYHVDNGGFTVRVDKFNNIEIEFGFFGYSSTTVFLSYNRSHNGPFGPKELGEFLIEAAIKNTLRNEQL